MDENSFQTLRLRQLNEAERQVNGQLTLWAIHKDSLKPHVSCHSVLLKTASGRPSSTALPFQQLRQDAPTVAFVELHVAAPCPTLSCLWGDGDVNRRDLSSNDQCHKPLK